MAFDRMAKRPGERAVFDLAFDQIVLRAFLHGFCSHPLVVQAGQHDHRDVWGDSACPPYRIETMAIRQPHVQQDNIHSTLRKMCLGFTQAQEVSQIETVWTFFAEHLAEQADISCIVFNEENLNRLFLHEFTSRGNLTTESQKLSILFTTVRNPSRPTGLVM